MMCKKCRRHHTGVCGIPAGVTLGFGARVSRVGTMEAKGKYPIGTKPKLQRSSTGVLEGLLAGAQKHLRDVTRMLRQLPAGLPEYEALLEREGKLQGLIGQLIRQIAARW